MIDRYALLGTVAVTGCFFDISAVEPPHDAHNLDIGDTIMIEALSFFGVESVSKLQSPLFVASAFWSVRLARTGTIINRMPSSTWRVPGRRFTTTSPETYKQVNDSS